MLKTKTQQCVVLLVAVSTLILFAVTENAPSNEILIKFVPEITNSKIDSLTKALGLTKIRTIEQISVDVFEVRSEYSVAEVVQICSRSPYVVYAEPSARVRALTSEEPEPMTPGAGEEAALPAPVPLAEDYVAGEVIIKFRSSVSTQDANNTLNNAGIQVVKQIDQIGIRVCRISSSKSVLKTVEECNADPSIEYAEPNYVVKTFVEPNDPRYSSLYGMRIIGGPEAWDRQTGSRDVIVGVIDTGIDAEHEDLQANVWTNPGESGDGKETNGVDDDSNGFVDDVHGWDFLNEDNNPFDDNEHGTHVSGTVGAVGNNGTGVVGVTWQVSLMGLKFLDRDGSGTTGDAVEAVIYGASMGAKVLSNSWGGGGRSQALEDAISFANDQGALFVAAAGNNFSNNDQAPTYPANYEVDNVIAVAASTSNDGLAGFSNFGRRTVHLAAPGSNILSSVPRNGYAQLSGTSMATPHVSGAAALVLSQYPDLTLNQLKTRLLGSVDLDPDFSNRVITGGRLNVSKALSTDPVIFAERLENTLDEAGPYVVNANIVDDGSVANASLTYQLPDADPVSVNMASQGNDAYAGEIPGQVLGTSIVYFVTATDNNGNETRGNNHTFSIAEPPDQGCGCGRPPLEFAIGDSALDTTVTAVANISLFALPFVALRLHSKRKKKRQRQ